MAAIVVVVVVVVVVLVIVVIVVAVFICGVSHLMPGFSVQPDSTPYTPTELFHPCSACLTSASLTLSFEAQKEHISRKAFFIYAETVCMKNPVWSPLRLAPGFILNTDLHLGA